MTITPKEFLETELSMGISADNPNFLRLAEATARAVTESVISVLDFGAGTGVYSDAFVRAGYQVYAYEIWEEHKAYIRAKFPHVQFASKPFTTDLMLFIEVAEHMTIHEIFSLFNEIRPKYILFSSTPHKNEEFDKMWGHCTILQPTEWDNLFLKFGYKLSRYLHTPTPWAKMYKLI